MERKERGGSLKKSFLRWRTSLKELPHTGEARISYACAPIACNIAFLCDRERAHSLPYWSISIPDIRASSATACVSCAPNKLPLAKSCQVTLHFSWTCAKRVYTASTTTPRTEGGPFFTPADGGGGGRQWTRGGGEEEPAFFSLFVICLLLLCPCNVPCRQLSYFFPPPFPPSFSWRRKFRG